MSTGTKLVGVPEEGRQPDFRYLASVEELKKTGQLTRWVDILLYEFEGQIKAISNICRHFGGPVGYHVNQRTVAVDIRTLQRFPHGPTSDRLGELAFCFSVNAATF